MHVDSFCDKSSCAQDSSLTERTTMLKNSIWMKTEQQHTTAVGKACSALKWLVMPLDSWPGVWDKWYWPEGTKWAVRTLITKRTYFQQMQTSTLSWHEHLQQILFYLLKQQYHVASQSSVKISSHRLPSSVYAFMPPP